MMQIRDEQMAVFREYSYRRFVASMHRHLRTSFAAQAEVYSDETLPALIDSGVARAELYAVTDEADVQRYIELMVCRGENFDTECTWAAKILKDMTISGTEKMDRIDDYELFVLEQSAGGEADL